MRKRGKKVLPKDEWLENERMKARLDFHLPYCMKEIITSLLRRMNEYFEIKPDNGSKTLPISALRRLTDSQIVFFRWEQGYDPIIGWYQNDYEKYFKRMLRKGNKILSKEEWVVNERKKVRDAEDKISRRTKICHLLLSGPVMCKRLTHELEAV